MYHEHGYSDNTQLSLNPLSPDIHLQILHADLYAFPLRITVNSLQDRHLWDRH